MKLYGVDIWDCRQYHLVLNISKISIETSVDMISQLIRLEAFQPTDESQKRIKQQADDALASLHDPDYIPPFFESMRDSPLSKKRQLEI